MNHLCNAKGNRLTIKFIISFLCLAAFSVLPGHPVSAQNNSQIKVRGVISQIPKRLPISIEILNEDASFIIQDVRIKVTNRSEKPIYFLEIYMETRKDFVSSEGMQYGFTMQYGRNKLIDVDNFAESEDVPIKPGESYTFRVEESAAKAFKKSMDLENRQTPDLYNLRFEMMNFGDGTGFLGAGGAYVSSLKRISQIFDEHNSSPKINRLFD